MPRVFNRLLIFEIEGEIYDDSTKAEDIIKNYNWNYKDYHDGQDELFIVAEHRDHRGRITKISKLPQFPKTKSQILTTS